MVEIQQFAQYFLLATGEFGKHNFRIFLKYYTTLSFDYKVK
jgi:hypothetical protein